LVSDPRSPGGTGLVSFFGKNSKPPSGHPPRSEAWNGDAPFSSDARPTESNPCWATGPCTKRELALLDWEKVQDYADAKTAVIDTILSRARESPA